MHAFFFFPDSDQLHSTFTLWERNRNRQLTDDLELHYIELPKFTPDKPKSVQTRFEKWLYVLKFSDMYHTRELPENLKDEERIQMAIDSMRKAYAREDIRAAIEAQEKVERDQASNLAAAVRKERLLKEQAERERDTERQRAHRLAAHLRELGIDPDSLTD